MRRLWLRSALCGLALLSATSGLAGTIDISAFVTDNEDGTYAYEFTVANNIPVAANQKVYFWGVAMPDSPTQVSPSGWADAGIGWRNAPYGGSGTTYDTSWIDFAYGGPDTIASGSALGGFSVTQGFLISSFNWFAFSWDLGAGPGYFGAEAFHQGHNPGFEGTGAVSAAVPEVSEVPEPGTLVLLGSSLIALRARRRRRS